MGKSARHIISACSLVVLAAFLSGCQLRPDASSAISSGAGTISSSAAISSEDSSQETSISGTDPVSSSQVGSSAGNPSNASASASSSPTFSGTASNSSSQVGSSAVNSSNASVSASSNPTSSNLSSTDTGWKSENLNYSIALESLKVTWPAFPGASSYKVFYKTSVDTAYTEVDSNLIDSTERNAYLLGLQTGNYDIKVVPVVSSALESSALLIENRPIGIPTFDRSGYGHFNYSDGVGAYKDDGTLKAGAVVVYIDDSNKNTVQATLGGKTYTGLVAILQSFNTNTSISTPLDIRLKGTIATNQFAAPTVSVSSKSDSDGPFSHPEYFANALKTTYASNLKGLTCKIWGPSSAKTYFNTTDSNVKGDYNMKFSSVTKAADTDSYFNMLDVTNAKNVTVEGVGEDVKLEQWGFTFSKCNSIEVKNLTFSNYPEDACSFQGGSNSDMDYSHFWLHHCTFNRGLNNWDLTYEQDKGDGDGGFDIKYLSGITSSYNKFANCHKTGLIGGSDSAYTKNVTYHHNHYYKCSARLPLGRQANMHFYNNFYDNCTTCQDVRANAYVLSEYNYFLKCAYPQKATSGAVIKSFKDLLSGCGSSQATVVTDRTKELKNTCKPDGSTDYSSFTTSPSLFYYDAATKVTKVACIDSVESLASLIPAESGKIYH